ncbi:Syntaxin-1A [Blyttiomyces sp. JEL0837]|nr:Syntaxin-1A [Blyttiomyces sp. JEL0837]
MPRDRMLDLQAGAGAPPPTPPGNESPAPVREEKPPKEEKKPKKEKKEKEKKEKDEKQKTAAVDPAEESEDMNRFYTQIDQIREDISIVKNTVEQIESAHQAALNVISEAQSAENTRELERLMDKVNKLSTDIRNKMKAMEAENKKIAKQSARSGDARIRISQHGALAKKFLDVMLEYKDIQKKYQDKYKQRMQRQYLIVKPTASPEEVEQMISGEQGSVFSQAIVHSGQKAEAKRALQDIKDRHADVQRIEQSIIELQQLFIDMSVLVAAQGELINQIEIHVDDAIDQTEQGVEALHKAVKLQKKTRKKMCIIIGLLSLLMLIIGLGIYFGAIKK